MRIGVSEVCKLDNEPFGGKFSADDFRVRKPQLPRAPGLKIEMLINYCVLENRCGAVNMTPAKSGV